MKTLGIKLLGYFSRFPGLRLRLLPLEALLLFGSLLSLWVLGSRWMQNNMPLSGSIDPNIWLLILLSMICFVALTTFCGLLLQRIWQRLGLPAVTILVSQFNTLAPWQQLGFFYCSFALLLLSAIGCLIAIC
jgi:hypothetical protein